MNLKNFGHIKSPYYGMIDSSADATILMMSDLQDPVGLIPDMIKEWENGRQIVLLQKESNTDIFILRTFKNIYYNFLNNFPCTILKKISWALVYMIKK